MFIKKVIMKNFGIVENQTLHFSNGINLFCGDNGKGKSTVLRAIALLIFNQYTGTLADYIKWGHEEEGFEISSEFSHMKVDYLIEYEYTKKKSNKKLTNLTTGEILENSSIIEFLNNLFDMKRAVASIISFENNIDLISTSPAERREYLKGIYDLNFKEQLKSIDEELLITKSSIITYQQKIIVLEGLEFNKLQLIRKPFSEENYKEKIRSEGILRNTISELKNKQKEVRTYEEKFKKLKLELLFEEDRTKAYIETLDSYNLSYKDLTKKYNELGEFSIEEFEEEKKTKAKVLDRDLKDLREEKEELEKEFKSLKSPRIQSGLLDDLDKLNEYLSETRGFKLQEENSLIPLTEGICPTCGQVIKKTDLSEKDIKSKKENINNRINSYQKELDKTKESIAKLKIKINSQDKIKEEFLSSSRNLERKIDRTNSYIEKQTQEIKNLDSTIQNKIDSARNVFDRDKNKFKNELEGLKNKIDHVYSKQKANNEDIIKIKKELDEVETFLSHVKFSRSEIFENEDKLEEVIESIDLYKNTIASNKEKKSLNEEIERKSIERDENVKEVKKDLEKLHETESIIILSKSILSKEFPSFVISRMIKSLKMYVNEFLANVYPKYEIELVESRSSLRVLYGPNLIDVKLASGFEQQIFSFAWKYALGKIQNYGLLILDEVDSAASAKNSEKLYHTLAKMYDFFKQVFVISHKPEIQELLSNDYDANVYYAEEGEYIKI